MTASDWRTRESGETGDNRPVDPYPTTKLLRWLVEAEKQQSGGTASGRGVEAVAAEELRWLRVFG
jgi:hypothetical protein